MIKLYNFVENTCILNYTKCRWKYMHSKFHIFLNSCWWYYIKCRLNNILICSHWHWRTRLTIYTCCGCTRSPLTWSMEPLSWFNLLTGPLCCDISTPVWTYPTATTSISHLHNRQVTRHYTNESCILSTLNHSPLQTR